MFCVHYSISKNIYSKIATVASEDAEEEGVRRKSSPGKMEWMTNITEAIVARARTIQHDPSSIITNTNTTNGTVWSLVISPSVYGTVFTLGCLLFFALAVHKEWVRSSLQFEPSEYLSGMQVCSPVV